MTDGPKCPECGAQLREGVTCEDYFYQMLFWENEFPENGEVHHLAVLCYHLQHPSRYSPEGLRYALGLLADFVERGRDPQEVRRRSRDSVDSGSRSWKITGRPGAQGAYPRPVRWKMTAADVVAGGAEQYRASVRAWARATLAAARAVEEPRAGPV